LGPARRPAVDELALIVKSFVAHRIPAGKSPEINRAAVFELLPEGLDAANVARLGGAYEVVIADAEQPRHVAEAGGIAVGQLLWRDPGYSRRLLDLLAVLVGAGEEPHPPPVEPHEPGQRVTGHRRIGVAQMRQIVDVIDRGRDEKRPVEGHDK